MWKLEEKIDRIIKRLGIKANKLDKRESVAVIRQTLFKFCEQEEYAYPMWSHIKHFVSAVDPKGWKSIADFTKDQRTIMFFEWDEGKTMYLFEKGNDIPDVLDEMFCFVFYLVDPNYKYILCFNDHDYLIGAGDVKSWLVQLNRHN